MERLRARSNGACRGSLSGCGEKIASPEFAQHDGRSPAAGGSTRWAYPRAAIASAKRRRCASEYLHAARDAETGFVPTPCV